MGSTAFFEYHDKEVLWLKSHDSTLGNAIDEIGNIRRPVISDLFEALIHSIAGQQISMKAHETVWSRIKNLVSPIAPNVLAETSVSDLQKCGITMRKALYIKEVADHIVNGNLNLEALHELSDEQVVCRLCQIRGVGAWTAEMLMIFSMQRPDVMSWNDLAIHRGLRMLYRKKIITPELFAKYKRCYSPYASTASLYIWAIAGGACSTLTDPTIQQKKHCH